MILITVGASNGLEEGIKQDMGNRVKNSAFMWGRSTSIPYKGYPRGRSIELNTSKRIPRLCWLSLPETNWAVGAGEIM